MHRPPSELREWLTGLGAFRVWLSAHEQRFMGPEGWQPVSEKHSSDEAWNIVSEFVPAGGPPTDEWDGIFVQRIEDTFVLDLASAEKHPPIGQEEGFDLLEELISAKGNLVFLGEQHHALAFMWPLLNRGAAPAVIGPQARSAAATRLGDVGLPFEEFYTVAQPTRVGAWNLPLAALRRVLAGCSGVLATVDGHRPERALMRFELGQADGTLAVLAGIDALVSVDHEGICEVVKIELGAEGYEPLPLFIRGQGRVGTGTDIGAAPTSELNLARLAPGRGEVTARVSSPMSPQFPPEPSVPGVDVSDVPPGWELDAMEDGNDEPTLVAGRPALSEDEAALAASYGVAPPPPPEGTPSLGVDNPTFAEALNKARTSQAEALDEDQKPEGESAG